MGLNLVPLKDLTPEETKSMTLDLLKTLDLKDAHNEKSRGQLVIELMYKPFKEGEGHNDALDDHVIQKAPEGTPDGGGLLVITVHEGQDLEGKHHTNPSVRLLLRGEEKRTKVMGQNYTTQSLSINSFCFIKFYWFSNKLGFWHCDSL